MNYSSSKDLLALIGSAKRVLINCHRNPDPDSIGSALSLAEVISAKGCEVLVISPSEIADNYNFLEGASGIKEVSFDKFDFSKYDLFFVLDTSSWDRVFSSESYKKPDVKTIVIDNHKTNKKFGDVNLIDLKTSSVCEILYKIYEDWEIDVSSSLANCLLTGIVGDTGSFQFEVYEDTFDISNKLLKLGADISQIVHNLYNSEPLEMMYFWGEALRRLTFDASGFVWCALPYSVYRDFLGLPGTRDSAATLFVKRVAGTKFGFIMTEDDPGIFTISFRAREDFDVSAIALKLGGGGHRAASGARIEGLSFEAARDKLVSLCRDAIDEN